MNRRRFFRLAAAATLTGCSRPEAAGTVRVSVGPYLYLCPLYLAIERGYFREARLSIELQQTPTGSQAIPLLASGKIDVSFSAPTPALVNAVGRGAEVRVVAAQDYTTPACAGMGQLLVRRSAYPNGLPTVRQLRGKRVAVINKGGLAEFNLDQVIGSVGMTTADVQMEILRPPEAVAALLSGQVDAIVTPDHYGKNPAMLSPDLVPIGGLTEVLPGFAYTYVMFGRRLLRGDAATGREFLSAWLRGVAEFLRGGTPRFLEEFARDNGMDPADARLLCRDTATADGHVQLESLRIFIDWAVRKGYCPETVPASKIVDTRFLAES